MTADILDRLIVWLNQCIAGELAIDRGGAMHFSYVAEWLADPAAEQLSHALPKQPEPFGDALCKAVFGGLLPEEGQRTAIARALGVSPDNPFRLLAALGGDVAGALAKGKRRRLHPQSSLPIRWMKPSSLLCSVAYPVCRCWPGKGGHGSASLELRASCRSF